MHERTSLHSRFFASPLVGMGIALLAGCQSNPAEPGPDPNANASATSTNAATSQEGETKPIRRVPPRLGAPGMRPMRPPPAAPAGPAAKPDPKEGKFTLADALKGLPAKGDIVAKFETNHGNFECKLFDDKAPITVANFVGLARGMRPVWDGSDWVTRPAYDNTLFHRIIKGFMIQGGSMNGAEETGYTIPDEIWPGAKHDRAGLLCMANRGANTNSKQFFITDDTAAHLDKGYTIFGECTPLDVIHTIAAVPVGPDGQSPTSQVVIKTIKIERGGKSAPPPSDAAPSASTSASAGPKAGPPPSAVPAAPK